MPIDGGKIAIGDLKANYEFLDYMVVGSQHQPTSEDFRNKTSSLFRPQVLRLVPSTSEELG